MPRKEGPRCDDASALPACSLSHPQLFRTTNHVAIQATAAGGPAQPRLAHEGGAGGAGSPLQRCNRERTSSAGRRAGWVGERAAGWLPGGCPRPAAAHPPPPWTWEPGRSAHAACCNPCLRCIGVEARWEPPKPHMSCRPLARHQAAGDGHLAGSAARAARPRWGGLQPHLERGKCLGRSCMNPDLIDCADVGGRLREIPPF